MNRVVVVLILILLPLLSCFRPRDYTYNIQDNNHTVKIAPIYIDEAWDENERAAIKEAINDWNVALNGKMILKIMNEHYKMDPSTHYTRGPSSTDPGLMIIKISKTDPIIKKEEIYTAYGFTNWLSGNRIYFVRDRLIWDIELKKERPWDYKDITAITLHELGHSMGADHIGNTGLMMPYYDRRFMNCIDATAVYTVASKQHLSPVGLRYCTH